MKGDDTALDALSDTERVQVCALLREGREYVKRGWVSGALATLRPDHPNAKQGACACNANDPDACRWCATGAICAAARVPDCGALHMDGKLALRALSNALPDGWSCDADPDGDPELRVTDYNDWSNDDPEAGTYEYRTQEQVVALYDEAIRETCGASDGPSRLRQRTGLGNPRAQDAARRGSGALLERCAEAVMTRGWWLKLLAGALAWALAVLTLLHN